MVPTTALYILSWWGWMKRICFLGTITHTTIELVLNLLSKTWGAVWSLVPASRLCLGWPCGCIGSVQDSCAKYIVPSLPCFPLSVIYNSVTH